MIRMIIISFFTIYCIKRKRCSCVLIAFIMLLKYRSSLRKPLRIVIKPASALTVRANVNKLNERIFTMLLIILLLILEGIDIIKPFCKLFKYLLHNFFLYLQ